MKTISKMMLGLVAALSATAAMAQMGPHEGGPNGFGPKERPAPHAITRAQALEMAAKHFARVDTNKDGILSVEEQKAAFERRPHPEQAGPHMQGPDGFRPHQELRPLTLEQALERAGKHFDRFDTNKDGVLSVEEQIAMHQHGPHGEHQGPPPGAPEGAPPALR